MTSDNQGWKGSLFTLMIEQVVDGAQIPYHATMQLDGLCGAC